MTSEEMPERRSSDSYCGRVASDPLLKLLPYGVGGTTALAVGLWAAKQYLGKLLDTLAARTPDGMLRLLGGRRSTVGRRFKRYRRSLLDRYAAHAIGFGERGTVDVNEVYVPLQYEEGERRGDVYERIRHEPRTLVLGPAGAGKSLLLKNSMLLWAADRQDRDKVPVLIELHRCSVSNADLVELIRDEFCRPHHKDVRAVETFVQHGLDDGRLRLLFDGLDEVSRDDRDRIARSLRDFAATYPKCQMVVTCRNAAYDGELAPEFAHVVRVADFDDASIRRFLGKWPGIDTAADVDWVFSTLRRSPPLMRLARSPLLLTMIAYLQTTSLDQTGSTLPNSRPEFYQRAISHLLMRDRVMGRPITSVYKPSDKLAVLQQVALALQEKVDGDRLTITRNRLFQVTRDLLLSTLNLGAEHVDRLLDELIERSQLLERIDQNGTRFRFPHLTLQEYLAAQALARDTDGLLARYRADPDSWRETVKLWCAEGSADSTEVVRTVYAMEDLRHRVLALECLADAARIDAASADEVITFFYQNILAAEGAVWRAFGAVAADSRPRGNAVLELLTHTAANSQSADKDASLYALSASGRGEAADFLASLADDDPFARICLQDMGEPAVPALAASAAAGNPWAVDALAKVATPAAAQQLADLLWSDSQVSTRAAWRLASLLPHPDIEGGLEAVGVPQMGVQQDWSDHWYPWIWEPFTDERTGSLNVVAGRIGYLIAGGKYGGPARPANIPDDVGTIDSRIGIPIAGIDTANRRVHFARLQADQFDPLVKALFDEAVGQPIAPDNLGLCPALTSHPVLLSEPGPAAEALRDALFLADQVPLDDQHMIKALRWPVQATLLAEILGAFERPSIGVGTWRTVRQTAHSSARLWTWTRRSAKIAATVASLTILGIGGFRVVETIDGSWPSGSLLASWSVIAGAVSALVFLVLFRRFQDFGWNRSYGLSLGLSAASVVYVIGYTFVLTMVTSAAWIGWAPSLTIPPVLTCLIGIPTFMAWQRDRAAFNPLRRCLAADDLTASGRTSVLAK
ncbi:MAG: hypothetical protein JWN00_1088 [Actinomycetia bacterium]|nr:hypothetical protein [Actinomycetes bacterium]